MRVDKKTKEAILRAGNHRVLKGIIKDEIDAQVTVLKANKFHEDLRYSQGSVNALENILHLLTTN